MDTSSTFFIWLAQYGSFALFGLLALGILALPVPEETLMVVAGSLMANGDLHFVPTVAAAYLGAITGISMSYGLGRIAGSYLIAKYGDRIGRERIEQVHDWFERYGKWTLCFGYFVPGVRHFTGFVAGVTVLPYHEFALFAYTGAIAWVSTFLFGGYFVGKHVFTLFEVLEGFTDELITAAIIIVAVYLWWTIRKFTGTNQPPNDKDRP